MSRSLTVLRSWIARLGVGWMTLIASTVAALVSLLVSSVIEYSVLGRLSAYTALITLLVSWPVSAMFSYLMFRLINSIELLNREIEFLANTDSLTGLANRRSFHMVTQQPWSDTNNPLRQCSVIVVDIDDFKAINDRYGHPVGDCVIQQVAERCRQSVRPDDLVARYGGEEFAILLPDTNSAQAAVIAERIRTAIERVPLHCAEHPILCTASFGIAENVDGYTSFDGALIAADRALYEAKRQGKNRVVLASTLTPVTNC